MIVGTVPAHLELIVHHLLLHWWLHLLLANSRHELIGEWCQSANFIYRYEKEAEKLNLEPKKGQA